MEERDGLIAGERAIIVIMESFISYSDHSTYLFLTDFLVFNRLRPPASVVLIIMYDLSLVNFCSTKVKTTRCIGPDFPARITSYFLFPALANERITHPIIFSTGSAYASSLLTYSGADSSAGWRTIRACGLVRRGWTV